MWLANSLLTFIMWWFLFTCTGSQDDGETLFRVLPLYRFFSASVCVVFVVLARVSFELCALRERSIGSRQINGFGMFIVIQCSCDQQEQEQEQEQQQQSTRPTAHWINYNRAALVAGASRFFLLSRSFLYTSIIAHERYIFHHSIHMEQFCQDSLLSSFQISESNCLLFLGFVNFTDVCSFKIGLNLR